MDRPEHKSELTDEIGTASLDPKFQKQVQRLHNLTVWGRWSIVALLWLTVAPLSLWKLRYEITLLQQHFTWTAVKYGIAYNHLPAMGLALCVGMTAAVLIWQSRNILVGMPQEEQRRLEKQVNRIRQQGSTHPLWKWVVGNG
ncbi:hypothetical protein H6S82_29875 [Planktothrix sp. FACHB-1355]|uniref:Uncharacterized protein n=1 Tax=Aerosakkonema funiforme FACHB-1375 TaxID=2949571 RepID=A0A926VDB7_9CYAN|nr:MULTISPECIES: hypothetical protein [Oscillatoriales]MBD2181630.1 hypothetical protein [Aerosakkonema funiforme FACHB-1375]MBD3563019.1 hypothetical protein [Planktothrix sp. FACHB-1355]